MKLERDPVMKRLILLLAYILVTFILMRLQWFDAVNCFPLSLNSRICSAATVTPSSSCVSATCNMMQPDARYLPKGAQSISSTTQYIGECFRRVSVFRTSFKYPLLRMVEEFSEDPANSSPFHTTTMVADHLLVALTSDAQPRLEIFLQTFPEVRVRDRLVAGDLILLQIPQPESPNAIDEWQTRLRDAGLPSAGPDFIQHHCAITTPNDPEFPQLWGLNNTGQSSGINDADIDAPEAWSITTGDSNVVVAVVDSGVDLTHPDLSANLWTNSQGKHGYDYLDRDSDPSDSGAVGHGTHVAGTIAASGNNGVGVCGVAWNAKIMVLRFLSGNGGATSDAISCIRYAVDNGAKIINNSWGGHSGSAGDALNQEITRARNMGVLFVAAAGNDGTNNDISPYYPANYDDDNIIAVAATDRNDALASFSNFSSTKVHLAAPGKDIRSTWISGGYNTVSGTSMAAPHVSGAAALLLAANPALTYGQLRELLLVRSDGLPALSGKVSSGRRLNVLNAVEDFAGPVLALTTKSTAEISGNSDGYANPGETFGLNLTLANNGSLPATGCVVAASLSSGAPATLNRTSLTAGTLASKASTSLPNAFQLKLSTTATLPATFTVTFTLSTPDAARTWSDSLVITIYQAVSIQGSVTRAANGAPITGATVRLQGPVDRTLQTDAEGRYLANVIAGNYLITATINGLLASETISLPSVAGSRTQDFSLGTAAISINPQTLSLTIPPGQASSLDVAVTHAGDSPRTLPFQVRITGTGLSQEHLYGLDMTGTYAVVRELNPETGAQTALHPLSLTSRGTFGIAATTDSLWLLTSQNFTSYQLVPLSTTTWTTGTPITINAQMVMSIGSSSDAILIVTTNSNSYGLELRTYTPASGIFATVGNLSQFASGPVAASATRQSLFLQLFDQSVQELRRRDFSTMRNWVTGRDNLSCISYSDAQNTLFTVSHLFTNSGPSFLVEKRSPDTGTVLSGFSAPSGISHVACQSSSSAKWITCGIESSDVATRASRTLPLTFSTAGMSLGQSFAATLEVRSSLLATPTKLAIQLTVGNTPPDPNSWDGWFQANFLRVPTMADASRDSDSDGISNFLEFATGGNPNSPIPHAGLPKFHSTANGRISWSYLRRKSLSVAELVPEGTENLTTWKSLPAGNSDSTVTESSYNADFQQVLVSVPMTDGNYFFRLRANP